ACHPAPPFVPLCCLQMRVVVPSPVIKLAQPADRFRRIALPEKIRHTDSAAARFRWLIGGNSLRRCGRECLVCPRRRMPFGLEISVYQRGNLREAVAQFARDRIEIVFPKRPLDALAYFLG